MKSLPIVQCPQCQRFLEFEKEDLVTRSWNLRYDVNCGCKTYITVPLALIHEMGWHQEEDVPPPPKEEKPPEEHPRARVEKAVQTYAAIQKCGTKAAAARELGVSVTTVNNRLKYLPMEYGQDQSAGSVPANE